MAEQSAFKTIESEDKKLVQRVERVKLFTNKYAVHKPFTAGNDIELVTTTNAGLVSSSFFTPITYFNRDDDDLTYFGTMRGDEVTYANASGSGMVMYSFKTRVQPNNTGSYVINDNISVASTTAKIDILSLSREFYYDKVDPEFFSMHLHTGSATTSSAITEFKLANGTIGLYPSTAKFVTTLGDKHFLYPTSGAYPASTTLYNATSDEMLMLTDANLDTTQPFGELFPDCGIVVLYVDKLKAEYVNLQDDTITEYLGAIAGRSVVQYNSTIIFARARASEFNYSTNPTYYEDYDAGILKEEFIQSPTVFVTQIGFYNDSNELVAVGKFNNPIQKDQVQELTIRAELSY